MKTLYFLFVYFLCFIHVFSQNKNYSTHEAIDMAQGIVSVNNKSYYAQVVTEDCCFDKLVLKCSNGALQDTWSRTFVGLGSNRLNRILVTRDKHILLLMHTFICDVVGNTNILAKVDTLGNVVFQATVQPGGFGSDITEYADSSFYMVAGSQMHRYSKTGQFLSSVNSPISNPSCISTLANGNLLISNNQYLAETTTAGVTLNQVAASQSEKLLQMPMGNIVSLSGGVLSLYSPTLGFVANANASVGSNYYFTDFILRGDTIFATGNSPSTTTPFYARLASNFSLLQPVTMASYAGVKPVGISLTNQNKVRVLSTCHSNAKNVYTFTGLYELPVNGSFYSVSDIGVTSATVTGVSYIYSSSRYLCLVHNMDVQVSNFGTDTVKSFYLNHFFKDFLCAVLLHKHCMVIIPPGQSVTVQTGTFFPGVVPTNSLGVPITTYSTLNVCVFTTVPNNSNDINVNNDAACMPITVGVNESKANVDEFQIFPNPVIETFKVSSGTGIKAYKLFNAVGQEVISHHLSAPEKELIIHTEELTGGVYFLNLETEKGRVVKKLIKEVR